jgi:hypothetical protein
MVVNTEFGCGKKQLYSLSNCLQKLRATGNNLRQDNQLLNQDSNSGTHKYFTLMPTKDIMIFVNPLRMAGWEKILQPGRQVFLNAGRVTTTHRHSSSEQFSQC